MAGGRATGDIENRDISGERTPPFLSSIHFGECLGIYAIYIYIYIHMYNIYIYIYICILKSFCYDEHYIL